MDDIIRFILDEVLLYILFADIIFLIDDTKLDSTKLNILYQVQL